MALVASLVAVVGSAGPAQAAGGTATYTSTSWGATFQGTWTIKNTGTSTLRGWTVDWDFPAGTTVSSAWEADVVAAGNHWTARNKAWNGTLAPGASTTFSFAGSGSGTTAPVNCRLNGASCDGSTNHDYPPLAPGRPAASNITSSTVLLHWPAASDDRGIRDYEVYRGATKVATVTTTSYLDTGLAPGTAQSYTVRARDTGGQTGPASPALSLTTSGQAAPGAKNKIGYFTAWGGDTVKGLVTSGSASKITHINYAFGNVTNGTCARGGAWEDTDKGFSAAESVDGVADVYDQPLKGHFNQLRKLKAQFPHIKILWSFGGWNWSEGFPQAMEDPAAFARSCYDLVNNPRWLGLFDGIDLDWEYPNACGRECNTSGYTSFSRMMKAMRDQFPGQLVTAAITADASSGGKMEQADYAAAAASTDFYNVMTYDFFGGWDKQGPTAPQSPLTSYPGIPKDGFNTDAALQKLIGLGIPAAKLQLGIPFYGRGWTGVTQETPGGTATAPAGPKEVGELPYRVLATSCPATGTIAGTAYAKCGKDWWSYDTPATIAGKMDYVKAHGLGGAFFWEFDGDTAGGALVSAIDAGLR
ncbi:glycoside hydrolase family 18 chitinase [Streptomyces sp. NPDC047023]|uniref:glycoside hydrolase family 18 chitinase n=1 Tax=Streptomyces sp. NPDC047023 TaxID=3155139 RepID=UPI0033F202D7